MHAVIDASDSGFFQYWNKLCESDSVQNPIYMQQRLDSRSAKEDAPQFTDRSFLIMAAEEPVFGCSLTLHLDEHGRKCIGYFGREASSHVNQSTFSTPTNNFRPDAIRLLQDHINRLIEEIQPHSIDYIDPVSCGVMSPVTQVLLEKGATPVVQKAQVIDLSISQRKLYRSLTKSCRGMVAWGRRNLEIEVISGDRFDYSQGEYAAAINTGSVPFENDKLTYAALIEKGNGFLVQGRYRGELVSSSLFVHNSKTCHYVFADNVSGSPDRPVLYALVWEAILRSKEMHCSQFDFGSTTVSNSTEASHSNTGLTASSFGGESHARLHVTLDRKPH